MFVTAWFVKKIAWASLRRGILNQRVLLELGAFAGLAGGLLGMFVSPQFAAGRFLAIEEARALEPGVLQLVDTILT